MSVSIAALPDRNRVLRRLRAFGCALLLASLMSACAIPGASTARATGDLRYTYEMPEAPGEEIPYRIFVPSRWNRGVHLPLVVVLHGYAGDADTPFRDAGGLLQQEAEKHGFVVLAPNGYNGMADYGANLPLPSSLSRFGKPLAMSPEAESRLAEQDVFRAIERVMRDYGIDPRRVYLMGNSMGMTGVLHLAAEQPERWCAISASDGPPWPDYPVGRLKTLAGVLFVHGENDEIASPADTLRLAERARAAGVAATMHVVPGGTHAQAWVDYLPQTLEFFARQDCAGGQAE